MNVGLDEKSAVSTIALSSDSGRRPTGKVEDLELAGVEVRRAILGLLSYLWRAMQAGRLPMSLVAQDGE